MQLYRRGQLTRRRPLTPEFDMEQHFNFSFIYVQINEKTASQMNGLIYIRRTSENKTPLEKTKNA
jgi:hypothetical protein